MLGLQLIPPRSRVGKAFIVLALSSYRAHSYGRDVGLGLIVAAGAVGLNLDVASLAKTFNDAPGLTISMWARIREGPARSGM